MITSESETRSDSSRVADTSLIQSTSQDFWKRYLDAGNPSTPIAELSSLSSDPHYAVRARVAQNTAVPKEIMISLIRDNHAEVRIGLAENPKTPYTLLQRLASDEDLHVRYDLAENPHTPELLLQQLRGDENPYVALRAAKTLRAMYPIPPECIDLTDSQAPSLLLA